MNYDMLLDYSATSFTPLSFDYSFLPPQDVQPELKTWRLGQFVVLRWDIVDAWERSVGRQSAIHQYTHVDSGVADHPLCVIGLVDGGRYVACVQGTSFGGTKIQDKFPKFALKRKQYLAIQQGSTQPHDDLPLLMLTNDQKMAKQTYLDMDHYFLIGAECLSLWADDQLQLDDASLATLERRFVDFTSGAVKRAAGKIGARSPVDMYGVVPMMLGVNDYRLKEQEVVDVPKFVVPPKKSCALSIKAPETVSCAPMVAAG